MKHIISIVLASCLVFSCAFLFGGCGKKHVIELGDTDVGEHLTLATGTDAIVYENLTDDNGETVTDAAGEAGTVAVTQAEQTTKAAPGETTTARKQETTTSSGKQETTTKASVPTTSPDVTVPEGDYVLTLKADKTEVKAGDKLTVTLHLKNCSNVACFGFTVCAGDKVSVTKYRSNSFKNENGENFDIYSNDTEKGVLFGGMITTTCDFPDDDLFTVTYQVASNAKKGDRLTFTATPTTFLVSPDDSGAETQDFRGVLGEVSVTVTVK